MANKVIDATLKGTWTVRKASHKTDKTTAECQALVGGSVKYGMGGKWVKGGNQYLALNGRLSRNGMPNKLTTKDGEIPISSTDIQVLIKKGALEGQTVVEFE